MHGVRAEVVEAQARATGLPLHPVLIPFPVSERGLRAGDGRGAPPAPGQTGVTRVVFGDLFLEDVHHYRELHMEGTGLSPVFPLWGRPTGRLRRESSTAAFTGPHRGARPEETAPLLRGQGPDPRAVVGASERGRPVRGTGRVPHLRFGGSDVQRAGPGRSRSYSRARGVRLRRPRPRRVGPRQASPAQQSRRCP